MIKSRFSIKKVFVYILLIFGTFCSLFPFYWMIKSSLIGLADIFQMPPKILPTKVHLSNYVTALSQYPFHKFFWNSCIITGLTVLGAVITSSMCAFAFSRLEWKWRDQIFYLILSGLMLPFFVVMIPQFMGWNALGQIDSFIPLIAPAWFGGGVFNIFLLRQFFLGVPKELDEAARVDGASYFRIYWQIIMPLSKQALIVVGLLTYLVSWNDYLAPMIYLSSQENYTLMLGLNLFLGSYSAQWNYMMAATSIIVIPSLIIFLFAQKHFIEGISMSGLKG
ncbi:MAG: carbohydrate ABC transporter permease [Anaeromicrobium sp.]|uniref:carbohydrate ABC transporter permease n=1 Tax=Anaeromicrobium sp. TaxID=1929132 RepID=UPI0025FD4599|nr:carbohydrate ABC transporter permease [Anaeromicrobium sp.]MCT4593712.1 carbohydrate ABC transporter permease [Anaeromicrobium sp.]